MANPEHVEIVKAGADAIEDFRRRCNDRLELSGVNLIDADLEGAKLNDANLSNSDLNNANLDHANLTNADLHCADLSRAVLIRADLRGADLSHATLRDADLYDADLRDADLSRAILNFAVFEKTILDNATFFSNPCGNTKFANLDLTACTGLETLRHVGPSSLGIDTLVRSGGKIPEAFMRGCGVPDSIIQYQKSFVNSPFEFYSCFISYSHEDKEFAKRLHDDLQGRGIRCWLDDHQLLPGDKVQDQIDKGIRLWDKVLLLASEHSMTSNWVNKELTKAFAKEERLSTQHGKEILALVPLNLDGYLMSDECQHPWKDDINERYASDFTNWKTDYEDYKRQLEKLVKALRADEFKREPDPTPKLGE